MNCDNSPENKYTTLSSSVYSPSNVFRLNGLVILLKENLLTKPNPYIHKLQKGETMISYIDRTFNNNNTYNYIIVFKKAV